MDKKYQRFLNELNLRSGGELAPAWRPEVILVGEGPGYLVVGPPLTEEEWLEKYGGDTEREAVS